MTKDSSPRRAADQRGHCVHNSVARFQARTRELSRFLCAAATVDAGPVAADGLRVLEAKVCRLDGELNAVALQVAFDDLVERHESLRTRFGFRINRSAR